MKIVKAHGNCKYYENGSCQPESDSDWPKEHCHERKPDYRTLESQLSAITTERDRMREALKSMLASFHDGIVPLCYRGQPGAFDCATQAIGKAKQALSNSAPSEGEVHKLAFEIACKTAARIDFTCYGGAICCIADYCKSSTVQSCCNTLMDYALSEAERQLKEVAHE